MPLSATDFLFGIAIPALVAGIVLAGLRFASPSQLAERFAPTLALVSAFLTGYVLLELGPLAAEAHWHWLPYAMLTTIAVAPVLSNPAVSLLERLLLALLPAVVAGWFLVPPENYLDTSPVVYLIVWPLCVLLLTVLLEPLPQRMPGLTLPLVLTATLATAAVVILLAETLRFSQVAGVGMAALLGMTVAGSLQRKAGVFLGIALPFSLLTLGVLLIAKVNSYSSVPTIAYALVAPAPALLWIGLLTPLGRRNDWKARVIVAIPSLLLLLAAVVIALVTNPPFGEEPY